MKKLAIGIDIGGINTAFGVVDEEGTLFAESLLSTRQYPLLEDYPRYVADLGRALHALVEGLPFDCEVIGIGIGAPNADDRTGTIAQPVNLIRNYSYKISTTINGIDNTDTRVVVEKGIPAGEYIDGEWPEDAPAGN